MVHVPMDVVYTYILPKLPTKSLLRFKSVSKSFKEIISSPNFIDVQRHHSLSSNSNRLVVITGQTGLYVYDLDGLSPFYLVPYPEFRFRYWYDAARHVISVVASCKSVVLIAFGDTNIDELALINPTTGSYTQASHLRGPQVRSMFSHCEYYGLGYDEKNDDYKIVMIRDLPFHHDESNHPSYVFIYSFNSDSWRKFEGVVAGGRGRFESNRVGAALINNHLLHWLFRSNDDELSAVIRIGCYDVCSEQWVDDVPLPESIIIKFKEFSKLYNFVEVVAFEECLCFCAKNKKAKTFDLWIMKEYGVQSSWFKLVAIPYSCLPDDRASMIIKAPAYILLDDEPSIPTDDDDDDGDDDDDDDYRNNGMYMQRVMVHPIAYRNCSRNEILLFEKFDIELFLVQHQR